MSKRIRFVLILALITRFIYSQSVASAQQQKPDQDIAAELKALVPEIRTQKKLAGLAAVVKINGKIVASAAAGERKAGSDVALTADDNFHVGSITKSMTATMLARLIERDVLDWETTVSDVFGESIEIHNDWQNVTIEQLMTHTSGAQPNLDFTAQFQHPKEGDERTAARLKFVSAILKLKLNIPPGTKFQYSNVGPTIAGAMAEKITGKTWEDLVRQEVFKPLNLDSAGFGPPQDTDGELTQPRGHRTVLGFKQAVGVSDDNTPLIGPAGIVHMSLSDLCTFGNEHLIGENGNGKLLTADICERLHKPILNDYAWGWVVPSKATWTDERFFWHNGSNTMWYALLVVFPEQNAVIAIAANDGDIPNAEAGAFEIVRKLFGK